MTISVSVAAVDSAPVVSFSWLSRSALMAVLPALSICSRLRCAGPSMSQPRRLSMLRVTCSTRLGRPETNWLTTKVRMPPKMAAPPSRTRATAPPRGAPRRSSQSTAGTINAATMVASATGTTMTCRRRTTHNNTTTASTMTSNRQAQAAVLRTRGTTESSSRARLAGMWQA